MRFYMFTLLMIALASAGCGKIGVGGTSEGSEQAARDFYDAEFKKWLAGEAPEIRPQGRETATPISYSILSAVPVKADILAVGVTDKPIPGSGDWPCYKFNIDVSVKSASGTSTSKLTTCTIAWNPNDKKWIYRERF